MTESEILFDHNDISKIKCTSGKKEKVYSCDIYYKDGWERNLNVSEFRMDKDIKENFTTTVIVKEPNRCILEWTGADNYTLDCQKRSLTMEEVFKE